MVVAMDMNHSSLCLSRCPHPDCSGRSDDGGRLPRLLWRHPGVPVSAGNGESHMKVLIGGPKNNQNQLQAVKILFTHYFMFFLFSFSIDANVFFTIIK